MQPYQSEARLLQKRASSSELSRWRDEGVDPELLATPTTDTAVVGPSTVESVTRTACKDELSLAVARNAVRHLVEQ